MIESNLHSRYQTGSSSNFEFWSVLLAMDVEHPIRLNLQIKSQLRYEHFISPLKVENKNKDKKTPA